MHIKWICEYLFENFIYLICIINSFVFEYSKHKWF